MVSYIHELTTLWRMWDPAFQVVRSQSNVIFDKERNPYASCLPRAQTDILEQPEETEYIEEIDSGDGLLQNNKSGGDGLLQAQDIETGGDGLLHDHTGTSRTDEGHGCGDHDCTDHDTDHNLPEAANCWSPPTSTGVRSCPPDVEDAPPVSKKPSSVIDISATIMTSAGERQPCPSNHAICHT